MNPFQEHSPDEMLRVAIALVILFSGIIAIIYSIWWGFLLITSWGSEEKVKPAVNHIRHALIGLLALVVIVFIAPKILDFFNLPYADEIRPTRIFDTIKELSSTVFGSSADTNAILNPSSSGDSQNLPSNFSDL